MRRVVILAAAGIISAVSVACQPGSGGLTEQDKTALRQGNNLVLKTALSEKPDWPALAAELYAQDADLLPPEQPPVKGLDAIKTWYSRWPRFNDFKLTAVRLEGSGGFAYMHYEYAAVPSVPEPVMNQGKGLTVFRKEADGAWKNVAECWNGDTPPSGITVPTGPVATDASAELKKLGAMVGNWKFDGTWRPDPKAAAGPVELKFTCAWFAGGRQVVYRLGGTLAGAGHEEMGAYAYDSKAKAYRESSLSSSAGDVPGPGVVTIKPGTWLHVYNVQLGGKPAKAHFTLSNMSPAGGDWKYELSVGGGPWTVLGEGKYVKAKSQ